jgi:DNA-binding HxlR family transcriptional regulator
MATPLPGKTVRGSKTGRPIMAVLDLMGRRWMLRVTWELRNGALTFRELQERCDNMSPTVLNQRLKDLREAGIVDVAEEGGYVLSKLGMELHHALMPLLEWSEVWHKALQGRSR